MFIFVKIFRNEKEKVRERIIRVASELFYKQGYNSTGINQIIAEADIAIGSLYNHFASKNDLLQAYLIKEEQEWFEGLEKALSLLQIPEKRCLLLLIIAKNFRNPQRLQAVISLKLPLKQEKQMQLYPVL